MIRSGDHELWLAHLAPVANGSRPHAGPSVAEFAARLMHDGQPLELMPWQLEGLARFYGDDAAEAAARWPRPARRR